MNPDVYVTRGQAAMITGVTADAIGKWQHRGWLTPDGERRFLRTCPAAGRKLKYRLGDILEAERDTRNSPNSRRGFMVLAA